MVFSNITFLLYFFPVFLLTYYLSPEKIKNYTILIASILFYSWGAPEFVFILLGSTILNYFIVKTLDNQEKQRVKKILLASSIVLNIGMLAYYKYANFFIENINLTLDSMKIGAIAWDNVILPIGISFFTFQSLTYSIDVYRGVHKPLKKLSDYTLYIIMFPQLIAGPIVRFNSIADQIISRKETNYDRIIGFQRFCIGLAKKVLIANVLGAQADSIMNLHPSIISTSHAWIGILSYTFQIYFDFSGYSDMAIGIGRMIGFKFPENFNNPYVSLSITEFWKRWHMTLGAWMRDYLYIPLGGNRVKTKRRLYFNLWFVFLLSGLWHGASWNFIIWGAYHGFFLIIERVFLDRWLKKSGKIISWIYAFTITMIGWVIFRIENVAYLWKYIIKLFSFQFRSIDGYTDIEYWVFLSIAILFSFITFLPKGQQLNNTIFNTSYKGKTFSTLTIVCIILLILSIGAITTSSFNPFIYFRF